jgi:PGF-CTERM protein
MRRLSVLLTVAVLLIASVSGASAALQQSTARSDAMLDAQSNGYDIDIPGSVAIPTREVTVEGTTYQVDAIARQDSNSQYTISVTAPSDATYDLLLKDRNGNTQRIIERQVTGSGDYSYDMSDYDPSTYYIVVENSGVKTIHPLVVRGYSVSASSSETATRGETIDASVSISQVDPDAPDPTKVQVVLGNETDMVRADATQTGDGSYEADLPTEDLSSGSYALYGVVRGPKTTSSGDQEALGISDRQDVTIESAATPTDTPTDAPPSDGGSDDPSGGGDSSDGGSSGGGSSGGSDPVSTPTPTATPTPTDTPTTPTATATPTDTPTESATATPTPTETPTVTTTPTVSPTATATPTDEGVITPSTPTSPGGPETTTGTGGQPGFGAVVAVVALLGGALLLTRRRGT